MHVCMHILSHIHTHTSIHTRTHRVSPWLGCTYLGVILYIFIKRFFFIIIKDTRTLQFLIAIQTDIKVVGDCSRE